MTTRHRYLQTCASYSRVARSDNGFVGKQGADILYNQFCAVKRYGLAYIRVTK